MNRQHLIDIGVGIGFVILQVVFFRHLVLWGIYPGAVLIFLLWYMIKSTRTSALLMAAFLGFLQDALLDSWGLNMIAKIVLVLVVQPWIAENMQGRKELPRVVSVVFIAALIHNIIILLLSLFIKNYSAELLFWRHWFGNAALTAIIAGLMQLFRTRKVLAAK